MIILGIDPGSLVTGFGLLRTEGNRFQMIAAGPIRLKQFGTMENRLFHLSEELENIIKTHNPDVLSVEKVFHGLNFQSTIALGYVRGIVMMQAARHSLTLAEYSPAEVKKAITGFGRAEKEQVQEMVRILLNLSEVPKPNDVADALALAICHAHAAPIQNLLGKVPQGPGNRNANRRAWERKLGSSS